MFPQLTKVLVRLPNSKGFNPGIIIMREMRGLEKEASQVAFTPGSESPRMTFSGDRKRKEGRGEKPPARAPTVATTPGTGVLIYLFITFLTSF